MLPRKESCLQALGTVISDCELGEAAAKMRRIRFGGAVSLFLASDGISRRTDRSVRGVLRRTRNFPRNVDGAPAPGKLVLFSYLDFPAGTVGGRYLRQGHWSDLIVYGGGCVPDGKCESIAHGKIWIDEWNTSNTAEPHPKHISGKYEIDISGKQLKGSFVADERTRRITRRLCV